MIIPVSLVWGVLVNYYTKSPRRCNIFVSVRRNRIDLNDIVIGKGYIPNNLFSYTTIFYKWTFLPLNYFYLNFLSYWLLKFFVLSDYHYLITISFKSLRFPRTLTSPNTNFTTPANHCLFNHIDLSPSPSARPFLPVATSTGTTYLYQLHSQCHDQWRI